MQVGAAAGFRIHPATAVVDLPYELWRCLIQSWNEKNRKQDEESGRVVFTNDEE